MFVAVRIFSVLAIVAALLSHAWVWGWIRIPYIGHWTDGIWWRLVSIGLVFNAVANLLLTRRGKSCAPPIPAETPASVEAACIRPSASSPAPLADTGCTPG